MSADWNLSGLEDDVRPRMFECAAIDTPFALATITATRGGPRPVGAQLLVTDTHMFGYLSGGCIEADVAVHGRAVLAERKPRALVYGEGSPFIDMRLPCGGRLDIFVEPVFPDDPALAKLSAYAAARTAAIWCSNGVRRACVAVSDSGRAATGFTEWRVERRFDPQQRLIVIGSDAFALAIAACGRQLDWDVTLASPLGYETAPPIGVGYTRAAIAVLFEDMPPDKHTAVAIATHADDLDHDALSASLRSQAGYIGILGARRRLPSRLARLEMVGFTPSSVRRLHAPIGINLGARSPREVAIAVIAEIIRKANNGSA